MTPVNLVMGFLGAGKTTAILNLLERKPAEQRWAVLVNEFGEIGIDGAIYASRQAVVREVPGGCLCCAAGLPFEVAVNRLLAEHKPDRLLIEPSGLGHPKKVLDKLTGGYFKSSLDVRAAICLLDPQKLKDTRYTGNENFADQIALADILVANKMDLADAEAVALFNDLVKRSLPAKAATAQTRQGHLRLEWLDLPRNPARAARFPLAHEQAANKPLRGQLFPSPEPGASAAAFRSDGHVYPAGTCFAFDKLYDTLARLNVERIKAVAATDKGWFIFNGADGSIATEQIQSAADSRIEWLSHERDPEELLVRVNQSLLTC